MHVGDLDGQGVVRTNNRWQAKVTITVHDAAHGPLSGVQVSGTRSAGVSGSTSCTTATNGQCTVTSPSMSRARTASVTFTVNNLTKSGYTYDSAANHDPEGDSNGTKITVNRP